MLSRITPSSISIILHMIRQPNSIIVLLFIQNNSWFKKIAKTCLPASMLSSSLIVYVFVQLRKYSPNSRCHPPSCLLAVFAMFLAIISPIVPAVVLTLETSKLSAIFFTTKTTQPRPQVFAVTVH